MPRTRLIEARWMRPHRGPRAVELRYADGSRRVVSHQGSLTLREAAKLLKTYEMAIYRLADRGKVKVLNGDEGFARIMVASLSRVAKEL